MKPSFENRRIAQIVREDLATEFNVHLDDAEVAALAEWFEESDIAPSEPGATFTHAPPW